MRSALVLFIAITAVIAGPMSQPSALVAAGCATPATTDVGTVDGWIGYLHAHPDRYGLDVTPLRGEPIRHNATAPLPTASSIKLVHLAAYTRAVAAGRIRSDDTVSAGEWERWYFPLDGGAHIASLKYLGIPSANGVATDPARRVTFGQLADVMIRFSDSAAPDLFRERLGDDALRDIMIRYHLGHDVPSLLGLYLAFVDPGLQTAAQRDHAARRYHDDPAYATQMLVRATGINVATVSSESTIRATPSSLTSLMTGIADGSLGPGAAEARRILEYQGTRPDGSTLGFKGGSLPGILTEVFEYRSAQGHTAVGTLMLHDLPASDLEHDQYSHQQLLLGALTDDRVARALGCIV